MIIRYNFCKFYVKTYVVTPHLKCLIETVQIRGNNVWFHLEIKKKLSLNCPQYPILFRALLILETNVLIVDNLFIMLYCSLFSLFFFFAYS